MRSNCVCGHDKRDHRRTAYGSGGSSRCGECKICLCKGYSRPETADTSQNDRAINRLKIPPPLEGGD
jgi:hypothetical protein